MNNLCQTPQKTLPAVVGILKALRVGCTNTYIYPRNINSTAHSEYRLLVNAKGYACTWNTNKGERCSAFFPIKRCFKDFMWFVGHRLGASADGYGITHFNDENVLHKARIFLKFFL